MSDHVEVHNYTSQDAQPTLAIFLEAVTKTAAPHYTPEQIAQQCIATLCDGVLRRGEAPAVAAASKAPRKSRRSSSAPLAGN